jgi:glutamine amidotransferase
MQRVVIIDYGSGNLHSAAKAFERAAREANADILVSARAEDVRAADRVVLPPPPTASADLKPSPA